MDEHLTLMDADWVLRALTYIMPYSLTAGKHTVQLYACMLVCIVWSDRCATWKFRPESNGRLFTRNIRLLPFCDTQTDALVRWGLFWPHSRGPS